MRHTHTNTCAGCNVRPISFNVLKKNLKGLWNIKYCDKPQFCISITKIFHYTGLLKCPVKTPKYNSQLYSFRYNSMQLKFWLKEFNELLQDTRYSIAFLILVPYYVRMVCELQNNWEDEQNLKIEMTISPNLY